MATPRSLAILVLLVLCAPLILAQSDTAVGQLNLTFTTIDVPGAMNTVVAGINSSGEMVGWWYNGTGATATGFLLSNGTFTFINYPSGEVTEARGINDQGLICGTAFIAQDTASVGFTYDGTTFTTISVPGKQHTVIYGINNAGTLVGGDGGASANQAFELVGTKFRNVTPPPGGYVTAVANGVNNFDEVVGTADANGFGFRGGKFQTIVFPGSGTLSTGPGGVNNSGIIGGTYEACSPCAFHGFVLMKGKYTSIDYPGAQATYVFGLNDLGQLVGSYTFDQQTFHGFFTSPINAKD